MGYGSLKRQIINADARHFNVSIGIVRCQAGLSKMIDSLTYLQKYIFFWKKSCNQLRNFERGLSHFSSIFLAFLRNRAIYSRLYAIEAT